MHPLALIAAAVVMVPGAHGRALPKPGLPVPAPAIISAACPDKSVSSDGCFYAGANVLYWNPSSTFGPEYARYVLEHERGHAWLARMADAGERLAIMHALGFQRWRLATDERAADAYASCRLNLHGPDWVSEDGWAPHGYRAERALCGLLVRVGEDPA